jgi:hypothetical protein
LRITEEDKLERTRFSVVEQVNVLSAETVAPNATLSNYTGVLESNHVEAEETLGMRLCMMRGG